MSALYGVLLVMAFSAQGGVTEQCSPEMTLKRTYIYLLATSVWLYQREAC